jgi:epoxide hydrolase-like predicted phosphatase
VAYLREQRQDHKVALISNAWSGLRAFITRKGFVDVFDHMIISAEVGIMKPDPRIYQLALEELEAKADESVFIDDVLVNVDSARSIGMLGIQFNQPKQVLSELKNLLNNHR